MAEGGFPPGELDERRAREAEKQESRDISEMTKRGLKPAKRRNASFASKEGMGHKEIVEMRNRGLQPTQHLKRLGSSISSDVSSFSGASSLTNVSQASLGSYRDVLERREREGGRDSASDGIGSRHSEGPCNSLLDIGEPDQHDFYNQDGAEAEYLPPRGKADRNEMYFVTKMDLETGMMRRLRWALCENSPYTKGCQSLNCTASFENGNKDECAIDLDTACNLRPDGSNDDFPGLLMITFYKVQHFQETFNHRGILVKRNVEMLAYKIQGINLDGPILGEFSILDSATGKFASRITAAFTNYSKFGDLLWSMDEEKPFDVVFKFMRLNSDLCLPKRPSPLRDPGGYGEIESGDITTLMRNRLVMRVRWTVIDVMHPISNKLLGAGLITSPFFGSFEENIMMCIHISRHCPSKPDRLVYTLQFVGKPFCELEVFQVKNPFHSVSENTHGIMQTDVFLPHSYGALFRIADTVRADTRETEAANKDITFDFIIVLQVVKDPDMSVRNSRFYEKLTKSGDLVRNI